MKIIVLVVLMCLGGGCQSHHEYNDRMIYAEWYYSPVQFVGKIVKLENISSQDKIQWLGTFVSVDGKTTKKYNIFENHLSLIKALKINFTGKDVYKISNEKIFKLTCFDDDNYENNMDYITRWELYTEENEK